MGGWEGERRDDDGGGVRPLLNNRHTHTNRTPTELKDDWDGVAARVSGGGSNKPRGAAECLAKFLSLPLEKQEGGKAGGGAGGGASKWVRGLAAGVDGQGACGF